MSPASQDPQQVKGSYAETASRGSRLTCSCSFFFHLYKIQVCNANVYLQKTLYFTPLFSTKTFIEISLESDQ